MEELKKKIFNILLNHSHASRTIATEELYELFVSKSKNSAVWVKASEFKTSEPVYRPYRRKRNNDNEEPYDYGEIYVTEDNGDIFFDVNNERLFEPQTYECWKDYEILDESGTAVESTGGDNIALYETRLALHMVLKVFKNDQISKDQEKYYSQAEYILQKHSKVTDVLRSGTAAAAREETEGVKAVVDALTTIYGTMIDPVMARQRSADMLNMANQALCKYDKERKGPAAGREEDAVEFAEWLDITRNSNNEIWKDMRIWGKEDAFKLVYELFKQQKENNG